MLKKMRVKKLKKRLVKIQVLREENRDSCKSDLELNQAETEKPGSMGINKNTLSSWIRSMQERREKITVCSNDQKNI